MNATRVVPICFDLHDLVRRSVATFYSHLVTRPTGHALRLGIEGQLVELGDRCLSVLDFTQVVVLDYSCADEAVAKLIQRFQRDDRPGEAYFFARGLAERHRETVEAVLSRHGLALVAECDTGGMVLLGAVGEEERQAWAAVERLQRATAAEVARAVAWEDEAADRALAALLGRRVLLAGEPRQTYYALSALLADGPAVA